MKRILEVCVDDVQGLIEAKSGGADRVELCSGLALGGLGPSPGLMAAALAQGLPAHVMIRPRSGDFVYTTPEVEVMERDIAFVREIGLAGVVLGANLPDGRLDLDLLTRLKLAASGLDITLHRAIDLCPDPVAAVAQAAAIGFTRILSSGGAMRVADGLQTLAQMQRAAAGKIILMPGSGVSTALVPQLTTLGVFEIHASCALPLTPNAKAQTFGFATATEKRCDSSQVAALRAAWIAA